MTLVTGSALDAKIFFKTGQATPQGSSFDLTVGSIYDHEGNEVEGPFTIKPGHMVQVVSAEVFSLSERHTGHVTYKTTLTKKGVWALTVGIVDPGWKGPIATTLLNFSRVDHAIIKGDAFLRVSLFEHDPVPTEKLRKSPSLDEYLKDIRKTAATMFPVTFLDSSKIAEVAGDNVLDRIRKEVLVWVALIAVLFTILQFAVNTFRPEQGDLRDTKDQLEKLRVQNESLQNRLLKLEKEGAEQNPKQTVPVLPPSTLQKAPLK